MQFSKVLNIAPLLSEEQYELALPEAVGQSAIEAESDPNQKERSKSARA
jgi:hypothetical protein